MLASAKGDWADDVVSFIRNNQNIVLISGKVELRNTLDLLRLLHSSGYGREGSIIAWTRPWPISSTDGGYETDYTTELVNYPRQYMNCMNEMCLLCELWKDPNANHFGIILIDGFEFRSSITDLLLALLKRIVHSRAGLQIIICCGDMPEAQVKEYFNAPMVEIPLRDPCAEVIYARETAANYLLPALKLTMEIHESEPPGSILLFLPGKKDMDDFQAHLTDRQLVVRRMHANLPESVMQKVYSPIPDGRRLVVLATEIAETSLTNMPFSYVVDTGYVKVKSYNPESSVYSLVKTRISKATAKMRSARSSLDGRGKCWTTYTPREFEAFKVCDAPEIKRVELAGFLLYLKIMGIDDLLAFDFFDPPPPKAVKKGVELLRTLGAVDDEDEPTDIGRKMSIFPVPAMLSRMMIASGHYGCSEEIVTIVAMLLVNGSIFYKPKDKQAEALCARLEFSDGDMGDHIALLRVFNGWKDSGFSSSYCDQKFLIIKSLKLARCFRNLLVGCLERAEIPVISGNLESVKRSILTGSFPNVAKLSLQGYCRVKSSRALNVHRDSSITQVHPPPKWVVYHEVILTDKEYMRVVTEIRPSWLSEFVPKFFQSKDVEDNSSRKMPKGKGRSPGP